MGAIRRSSSAPINRPIQWKIRDRDPMNQVEFDSYFGTISPKTRNELILQANRSLVRVLRPFTSILSFWKTLVSFVPILQWLPKYSVKQNLIGDITGGIMVGIVHVPQGLAYGILAGVNPAVGLYTSFFPVLAYMLFGTSRHSSIGTIAIVAIMTGSVVNKYAVPSGAINMTNVNTSFTTENIIEPIEVTVVLSLAAGLTQIIIAIVGLDFVTTYFSEQVVDGFATAAAMHAMVAQLKDVTGIYDTPRRSGAANVIMRVFDIAVAISRTNLTALLVTAITTAMLLVGNLCINSRVMKRSPVPIPFELLLVIAGAATSWLLDLETKYDVMTVGPLETGLPVPIIPRWKLLSSVALDAIPIAVVSVAIHISMAKLLAKKHNYALDLKQEFYAVGFASTISSFFPVFPCCCSVARTLLNSQTGGNTQFSAIFSSLFIFCVLQFGGKFLQPVPMCVLASIIIVALCEIRSKFKQLPSLWAVSKIDFAIWVVAFTATTFIDVIIGLAVSITFALFTTVIRQQLPKWHVLGNVTGTAEYKDIERYKHIQIAKDIIAVRFDAPLLFTNVVQFQEMVEAVYQKWEKATCNSKANEYDDSHSEYEHKEGFEKSTIPDKFLIIDCSTIIYIDIMGAKCLVEVYTSMLQKGVQVMFASAKAPLLELFEVSGHYKSVSKAHFYPTLHDAMFFAQHERDGTRYFLGRASGVVLLFVYIKFGECALEGQPITAQTQPRVSFKDRKTGQPIMELRESALLSRGMVGLRRVSSNDDLHNMTKLEDVIDQNADIRGEQNLTHF